MPYHRRLLGIMKADRVWSTTIRFVFHTPRIEAIIPVLLRNIPVVKPCHGMHHSNMVTNCKWVTRKLFIAVFTALDTIWWLHVALATILSICWILLCRVALLLHLMQCIFVSLFLANFHFFLSSFDHGSFDHGTDTNLISFCI